MTKLIKIISDDHPFRSKVIWIPTGEMIPVLSFQYSIEAENMGRLWLEIPNLLVDINIETENIYIKKTPDPIFPEKKPLLDRIHNTLEMIRLGLGRIN
jgi:hypothetical protein